MARVLLAAAVLVPLVAGFRRSQKRQESLDCVMQTDCDINPRCGQTWLRRWCSNQGDAGQCPAPDCEVRGSSGSPTPAPAPPTPDPTPPGTQPNILLILTDDQGYDDVGFRHVDKPAGQRLRTPTIDQLANESVQFDEFYVNAFCSPTRASLLTGRHHLEVGVWSTHGGGEYLSLNVATFANELQPLGYRTSFFGKWHSGEADGYWPHHRGFNHSVMADLYRFWDNDFTVNGEPVQSSGWAEEVMAQYALEYLDEHAASGTSDPFLMYYAPMTPHTGEGPSASGNSHHAPEDMIAAYVQMGFSAEMSRLYAAIEFMDIQLGLLLGKLSALGLDDSTVVFFLGDNGPQASSRSPNFAEDWAIRNPSGMLGSKGHVQENGVRQNLFVRWAGSYTPAMVTGSVCSVTDLLPTMVDLAGGVLSPGQHSLVPLLEQRSDSWFETRYVYNYLANQQIGLDPSLDKNHSSFAFRSDLSAIWQGDYKLTVGTLYNLTAASHIEQVSDENAAVAAAMNAELQRWWQEEVLASPYSFVKGPIAQ